MNLSGFDFWRTRESVERLEACFGMCKKQDKKKTVLLAFSLISFADVIGHLWSLVLIVFDELVFVSVNGFHTFIANFSKKSFDNQILFDRPRIVDSNQRDSQILLETRFDLQTVQKTPFTRTPTEHRSDYFREPQNKYHLHL